MSCKRILILFPLYFIYTIILSFSILGGDSKTNNVKQNTSVDNKNKKGNGINNSEKTNKTSKNNKNNVVSKKKEIHENKSKLNKNRPVPKVKKTSSKTKKYVKVDKVKDDKKLTKEDKNKVNADKMAVNTIKKTKEDKKLKGYNKKVKSSKIIEKKKHNVINFIVLRLGGSFGSVFNDISYTHHNHYNKVLDNFPVLNHIVSIAKKRSDFHYSEICKSFKDKGLSYLLSNFIFTCDLIYNKFLFKKLFFNFGLSFRYLSKVITDQYLKNVRIYLEEFNDTVDIGSFSDDDDIDNKEKTKIIKERKLLFDNEGKCYENLNSDIADNYNVHKMSFLKIGGVLGFSVLFDERDYQKSFFIAFYLFLRYRRLMKFELESKGVKDKYILLESKYLRINPFDFSLGIEFGKSNIVSVLCELGLTSILRKLNPYNSKNYFAALDKNMIKLRDINISFRYNKF